jgi:hypothetical protein
LFSAIERCPASSRIGAAQQASPGWNEAQSVAEYALPQTGPAAALAFDDLVALLQQTLALAILAFLLFLDVGAFFICHGILPAMGSRIRP